MIEAILEELEEEGKEQLSFKMRSRALRKYQVEDDLNLGISVFINKGYQQYTISSTEFARGLGLLYTSNKEKRVKGAYKGRKHSKVTTVVVFCIELKGYYLRGSESPSFQ